MPLHRGMICQFQVRWVFYYNCSESTGKKTNKTHLCALCRQTNWLLCTACFVESVHFFLVILVILLTAEPVRILKMEVPQVSNFEFFTAEPLKGYGAHGLRLPDKWSELIFVTYDL